MTKLAILAALLAISTTSASAMGPKRITAESPQRDIWFKTSNGREIKAATLKIRCYRDATVPESLDNGFFPYARCDGFLLNGSPVSVPGIDIELVKVGKNMFRLDYTRLSYLTHRDAQLCIKTEVRFDDEADQRDYFADPKDASSVISFCSKPPVNFPNGFTFVNVHPLQDFEFVLGRPVQVKLKK